MKTRSFLRTTSALGTLALALVLPTSAFARVPQVARPVSAPVAKAQASSSQKGYIRELRDKNGNSQALQTVIRRFTPLRGNGPSISLVAAVHVGEESYYKQVQQFLDKQDVVLFEGVRASRTAPKTYADAMRASAMRDSKVPRPPAGNKSLVGDKPPVGIQKKMSDALNLQFQLDGIHYNRPQFRNSDLDWQTLNALATKAGPDTQKLLGNLSNSVSGGPAVTASALIIDRVLTLSASTPLLATVLRRLLITVLGKAENMEAMAVLAQTKGDALSSAKKLDAIIVEERNKAVLADIKALLQASKKRSSQPIRSIAVFYGAGHMRDMEQHLVSDLGYRPAGSQWLTAIQAVHPLRPHK